VTVAFLQDAIDSNKTFQDVYPTIVEGCMEVLNSRHKNGKYMCPGLVADYGPVVSHVDLLTVTCSSFSDSAWTSRF